MMRSDVKPGRRRRVRALPLPVIFLLLAVAIVLGLARAAEAVPGQSRGVVALPGNGACSVGGTHDGTYYITVNTNSCSGTTLGIYLPPPTGAGPATLVSTKTLPVTVSAVDWDRSRNLLWAVFGSNPGNAYLVNLGDKTMSGTATATHQFTYSYTGEFDLIDGLAWDPTDDTLWISPDVSQNVFHHSTAGALLGSIQPKNMAGVEDGLVSGVAIGAANTLYIGRNGTGEIRRVDKATGNFVSTFATANFRIEDLVCALHPQPVGGPIEAILAKDAFGSSYEAFEVEPGTCPPPAPPCPPEEDEDDDGVDDEDERNILGLLLNDSDSDDDGINDGNDDGNGNGEDDEDEDDDDDDDCPEEDDDGDGTDDEDEDDD